MTATTTISAGRAFLLLVAAATPSYADATILRSSWPVRQALVARVNEHAKSVALWPGMDAHATITGRSFNWLVLCSPSTAELLQNKDFASHSLMGRLRALLLAKLSRQLLQQTVGFTAGFGLRIDDEADVSVTFAASTSEGERSYSIAEFHGRCCTYLNIGHSVYSTEACATPTNPQEARLLASIEPRRATWAKYETITGQVRWRNVGAKRVIVHPGDLPGVGMVSEAGEAPPWEPGPMMSCGFGEYLLPVLALDPGEEALLRFEMPTDPLSALGSYRLTDGAYQLRLRPTDFPLASLVERRTPIQVHATSDQTGPPRIVEVAIGGPHLAAMQENGTLSTFELTTGRILLRTRVAGYRAPLGYEFHRQLWLAPDGRYLAVRTSQQSASSLHLFASDALGHWSPASLPEKFAAPGWAPHGFDAEGGVLQVLSREESCALDVGTGEFQCAPPRPDDWQCSNGTWWRIGPDGLWFDSSGPNDAPRRLPVPEGEDYFVERSGARGLYLRCPLTQQLYYVRYDGMHLDPLGEHPVTFLAESPDGRYAALGERKEGHRNVQEPIAIWQVDPPRFLWRRQETSRVVVAFGGIPPRVVFVPLRDGPPLYHVFAPELELRDIDCGRIRGVVQLEY